MQVFWWPNLMCIDNPTDPYLVERIIVLGTMMVIQQLLKVHRVDESSFTIPRSVNIDRLFHVRESRARAQACGTNRFVIGLAWPCGRIVGKQVDVVFCKIK